jgi:maleylpyruvate isomerase
VNQSHGPHAVDFMIEQNEAAVDRLLESASALSDDQMREPSLLPGWSRGHVLTHVARSGDGLANLLTWAETGIETPQYPSAEARAADIEAGAGRSAGELSADVAGSAKAFIARARALPDDAWLTVVRGIRGPAHPAWFVLNRRLFETEVHHADLGWAYGPSSWPDWFVSDELYRVTGERAQNPDCPSAVLTDISSGRQYFLRASDASATAITGTGYALLAWLVGRESDGELSVDPAGPLPDLPSYG